MLYSAPRFGAYTAEEIQRFYPLLENDFNKGYTHDCPLRIKFRQLHGQAALDRYNHFTRTILTTIPDYEKKLPSLEQLLAAVVQLQTPTPQFIVTTVDNEESPTKSKRLCCSLM